MRLLVSRWTALIRGMTPAYLIFLLTLAALPLAMYATLMEHSRHQAMREAEEFSRVISLVRSYYARNVTGRILSHPGSVTVTENYATTPGGIPIPATLSIELGDAVNRSASDVGFTYAFVSDAPFVKRRRDPLDDFQNRALASFRQDSQRQDFMEESAEQNGRLRLALPVRMEAACVACHNAHPDSPRRDWKVGDVRGIQEVSVNLSLATQAAESTWFGLYLILFIGSAWVALREYRKSNRSLLTLNDALHQSERSLQQLAQELRMARDAAEESAQVKANFLANMSHELRTPISAVMGMAYLASQTGLSPQQRDYLDKIQTSGRHLLNVVNDILDFSKIEAGKMTVEHVRFDLAATVQQALSLVTPAAQSKGLDLQLQMAPTLPRHVMGDPHLLMQVLTNLLSNAVKFTPQGHVRLDVTNRDAGTTGPGVALTLEVTVSDTGIGMTAEQQSRLFRSFEQADGSITRQFGGTGLGLAISRNLCRLMGGDIGVHSALGQGSTFWFTCPVSEVSEPISLRTELADEASPGPASSAEQALPLNCRVLLVEDNAINQQIAQELLRAMGAQVHTAVHGQQALDWLQAHGPASVDLVLMDMQMPVLDGLSATQQVRALGAFKRLPIIAMTANVTPADRQRCLQAGMNDHLGKPIDPQELRQTLLRWGCTAAVASASKVSFADGQQEALAANKPLEPATSLPDVPTLDTREGLFRCGGQVTIYLRVLTEFVQREPQSLADLRRALSQGDWAHLERTVHGFKAAAGTMGAKELQALAAHIEHDIGDARQRDLSQLDDGARGRLDDLVQQRQILADQLKAWLAESSTVPISEEARVTGRDSATPVAQVAQIAQLDQTAAWLDGLRPRLLTGDADVREELLASRERLLALLGEAGWLRLEAQLQQFDFDAAWTELSRAVASV